MDVTITRFVPFDGEGSLKAFCDVAVGDLLLIKGVRILEGRRGLLVRMPRQQSRDGIWYDSVVPLSQAMKTEISSIVLETFERHRAAAVGEQSKGR